MINMTEGPILSVLLTFALPLMLGSLFTDLYNLADLSIAGYTVGDSALAAIAASSGICAFMHATSMGFNIGSAIAVSNAYGAGDMDRTRRSLAGMLVLFLFFSFGMTLLMGLSARPLMRLIRTPDQLFEEAWQYLIIITGGLVFSMAYHLFACAFRALGNSRIPLFLLIICSLLNIGLDILFMAVFGWGVTGAALATVLSQAVSAAVSAMLFIKMYPELHFRREDFTGIAAVVKELFPLGISGALTNSMFSIGWIFMQAAINALGQDTLAAYAVSKKIQSFAILPSVAIANALSTFSAQNFGAKKFGRITKGILSGCLFSLSVNVFSFLIVFLFGRELVQLMTNTRSETVIMQACRMTLVTVGFVWAQTVIMGFRMSIQGMRKKLIPVLGTFFELIIRAFFALVMVPMFGYIAIGWAESACWVLGGIMMVICFAVIIKHNKSKSYVLIFVEPM